MLVVAGWVLVVVGMLVLLVGLTNLGSVFRYTSLVRHEALKDVTKVAFAGLVLLVIGVALLFLSR